MFDFSVFSDVKGRLLGHFSIVKLTIIQLLNLIYHQQTRTLSNGEQQELINQQSSIKLKILYKLYKWEDYHIYLIF